MTDGYWNGWNPGVGNQDGDQGAPYRDDYTDTLADVAMKYYKNDLSLALDNTVAPSGCDQATHQHMAFVIDEYGTVIGTVTLENVIEQIVGSVEDEFDIEEPEIVPDGPNQYIVLGSTPLEHISKELNIHIESGDVDTFSGALTEKAGRILKPGDQMELPGAAAEVIEVKGSRAIRIRVTLAPQLNPS